MTVPGHTDARRRQMQEPRRLHRGSTDRRRAGRRGHGNAVETPLAVSVDGSRSGSSGATAPHDHDHRDQDHQHAPAYRRVAMDRWTVLDDGDHRGRGDRQATRGSAETKTPTASLLDEALAGEELDVAFLGSPWARMAPRVRQPVRGPDQRGSGRVVGGTDDRDLFADRPPAPWSPTTCGRRSGQACSPSPDRWRAASRPLCGPPRHRSKPKRARSTRRHRRPRRGHVVGRVTRLLSSTSASAAVSKNSAFLVGEPRAQFVHQLTVASSQTGLRWRRTA